MVSNVNIQQPTLANQCPHGMPLGGCPICNPKMGGGGKKRDEVVKKPVQKPAQKPVQNPNEWSYARCLAEGRRLQAQKANAEAQKLALEKQISGGEKLAKNLQIVSDKIQNVIQNIKNPQVQQVVQTVANAVMNVLKQIPKALDLMQQTGQKLVQMLQGAGEKLTAILGDIKNFISRKFSEDIKKRAKKIIFSFFVILEGENYHDDETLAIFKSREIRKFIVKIFKQDKRREDDTTGRIKKQAAGQSKKASKATTEAE